MEQREDRKQIRLKRFDYSSNAAYFITVCAKDRECIFGKIVGYDACDVPQMQLSSYGKAIEKYLHLMDEKYLNVFIDKYAIMPNHVHMIVIVSATPPMEAYRDNVRVGYYGTSQASYPTGDASKRTVLSASGSRSHEILPKFISLFKRYVNREIGHNVWQRRYYDHIIRNEDDYRNTWQYIENNPARWAEDEYYQ